MMPTVSDFKSIQKNRHLVMNHSKNIPTKFAVKIVQWFQIRIIQKYFPISISMLNLFCSDNHVGWILDLQSTQKLKFCKGPSNDYSCTIWVQSDSSVLYFHFPTSMSCCVNHSGFLISTKDRYFLKCNSRNILIKLLLEWFSDFREKWFKIFPVRTIDEKWSHNSHQPWMPGELINNDRTRFAMMKWIYDMHNERNKQSNLVISK